MFPYLVLSFLLFIIGCSGTFLSKKHIILILISFELVVLAVLINFLTASIFVGDLLGQIYCL